jgi:LysM repeat protein
MRNKKVEVVKVTRKDERLDQAEELRKRMDGSMEQEQVQDSSNDPLNLPPRSERHEKEEKKTKFRIKHPLVRLLGICFILIPGTIVAYIIHQQNKPATAPNHYERVTINQGSDSNQKKEEPVQEEPKKEETKAEAKEEPTTGEQPSKEQNVVQPPKQDNMIYHTVQEGDTLYKLSMKYFGKRDGERLIQEYNQLTSQELEVGSVLKFPKDLEAKVK